MGNGREGSIFMDDAFAPEAFVGSELPRGPASGESVDRAARWLGD